MVLSVSMKIGTIKKHFQQFSKHTVMPAAIYELCLGGSVNGRTNRFLYMHNSGYLAYRGTSQMFCENKKALSLAVYRWLAKNKWEVQAWLNRAAAENSDKWFPALFFHKLCFGGCRNETRCRVMLSITSGVRGKSCLISILPTCSLESSSLSIITVETF